MDTHRIDIPYSNGVVIGSRGEVDTVWRPRDIREALCMTIQITDEIPGKWRPYLGDVVSSFFEWGGSCMNEYAVRRRKKKKRDVPQDASKVPSGLNFTDDMDMV
jgi:hypothetical protein